MSAALLLSGWMMPTNHRKAHQAPGNAIAGDDERQLPMTERLTREERAARCAAFAAADFERGRQVASRAADIGAELGGLDMLTDRLRICTTDFKAGLLHQLLTMAGIPKP